MFVDEQWSQFFSDSSPCILDYVNNVIYFCREREAPARRDHGAHEAWVLTFLRASEGYFHNS